MNEQIKMKLYFVKVSCDITRSRKSSLLEQILKMIQKLTCGELTGSYTIEKSLNIFRD